MKKAAIILLLLAIVAAAGAGYLYLKLDDANAKLATKETELNTLQLQLTTLQELLDAKTSELDGVNAKLTAKETELNTLQLQLDARQEIYDAKIRELDDVNAKLVAKETELNMLQLQLAAQKKLFQEKTRELNDVNAKLTDKETELNTLQLQLAAQQELLDAKVQEQVSPVYVRMQIIQQLFMELKAANLDVQVDPNTGDIVLSSTVFFETNSYAIKAEGQALLQRFLPVYLDVLLQDQYADYLGEIIVEGHTDSTGTYINSLKLSQNRALTVVEYCLQIVRPEQRPLLQSILTAKGRSSSDLIYDEFGNEDKNASRRVEFKFSLKDAEMIDEMNRIINMTGGSGTSAE